MIKKEKHLKKHGAEQPLKFDKKFFCDLWDLLKPYWASDENQLYESLKKYLPNITLISVGHRNTLHRVHERVIDFRAFKKFL